ncbi:hypothetical protein N8654_02085 [Synechococcus sp. AH-601-B19]|nr:hypothetical protein [Synechococcus sp. AH-601-B19]
MSQHNSQFQEILDAAKEKRGDLPVDTMIVSSHLAQMRMFILRRGLEFYCEQDSYGGRREFIKKVYEDNMLEMKLESIIDYFLCDGQGLFYFRPSGENYQLLYFPKDSYRAYRDQYGQIDTLELIYSFSVKEKNMMDPYAMPGKRGGRKKYIKLKVRKDVIEQTISNEKIEFEDTSGLPNLQQGGHTEELTNSLGFIPAVEVFNHLDCTGESTGTGEFDWLSNQILFHDELVRNVRKNMKFFGNPTLVSSRPKHDILESGDENTMRPTISSQAGFYDPSRSSSRVSQPFGAAGIDGQIKVPRVIANLEPTDRVNYMTPDAVSGDQNMYVKQYRSEIRLALGGVDDIDIGTASTAYEMKSLYGRVSATAEKKCRALFDFGLSKLFSMMIQHEEFMFEESFAQAMELKRPEIPLEENFEDRAEYEQAQMTYMEEQKLYLDQRAQLFNASIESGQIPNGVIGLIPDGSSKVSWRWTGEIFEEDSQGILNNSIVVRNLQELGVDSIEALKYLFPSKTDEERASMLTGYPFRMVQQSQQAFQTFTGMLQQLYAIPHPQMPSQPLAADPNLDLTGFLYRSLEFLRKELSYSGKYQSDDNDSRPGKLSDADIRRAELGLPTRDERPVRLPGDAQSGGSNVPGAAGSPGLSANSGPAGFGGSSSSESMAAGVPGSQRKPEFASSIPGPGVVLGLSDADTSGQYPGNLGFTAPAMGKSGSADLRAGSFDPSLYNGGSAGAAQ